MRRSLAPLSSSTTNATWSPTSMPSLRRSATGSVSWPLLVTVATYSRMVDELRAAVTGDTGRLGNAVRAMFDLRMAAQVALTTPLADASQVAGPSFLDKQSTTGASS